MSLVIKAWDLIKSKVQPAFAFALRGQKKKSQGNFSVLGMCCSCRAGIKECPIDSKDLASTGHWSERPCGRGSLNIAVMGTLSACVNRDL